MNEEQKHKQFVQMAELMDVIDKLAAKSEVIEKLPFDMIGPEIWADVVATQPVIRLFLNGDRESLKSSVKLIDNDALYAHMQAVIHAPE